MPLPEPVVTLFDEIMEDLVSVCRRMNFTEKDITEAVSRAFANTAAPEVSKHSDLLLTREGNLLMSQMVANWLNSKEFVDAQGDALPLPADGEPSIRSLYETTAPDFKRGAKEIDQAQALRRLINHNVIKQNDNGSYNLIRNDFPTNSPEFTSGLTHLGFIGNYVATAAYNMDYGGGTGRFMRQANMPSFPLSQLPTIKSALEEHGMQFLRFIDGLLESKAAEPVKADDDSAEVGISVFMYIRESDSSDD